MDFVNEKEGDLDALISTHRIYLDRMVKKLLLIGSKAGREVDPSSDFSKDQLLIFRSRRAYSIRLRRHFH